MAKISHIARGFGDALLSMMMRPHGRQVAALCTRKGQHGLEFLLVTSRRKGRWIIPKGWPMEGKSFPETALEEAWEEAGVRKGQIQEQKLGHYTYQKEQKNGTALSCLVDVYLIEVDTLEDDFPESKKRKRRWVSKGEAIELLSEPELKELIRII
ncbi:MAG: NUDIX hydrolase [Paracoccaceae bacterium]